MRGLSIFLGCVGFGFMGFGVDLLCKHPDLTKRIPIAALLCGYCMCAWGWWLAGKLDAEAKIKKKDIRT